MTKRISRFIAVTALIASIVGAASSAGATDHVPSGQRVLGQSVVEPVYDAQHAGVIGFISTPAHAPLNANPRAVAPLFLPVYPVGSTVGALICPHTPVDSCPDHGPAIAGLAQTAVPAVYGTGVLGHDHLMEFRGGDDFNIAREPVVVLFTTRRAANEHLLTRAQIEGAIDRGDAIAIPLPPATLHAEEVPTQVWNLATPIQ